MFVVTHGEKKINKFKTVDGELHILKGMFFGVPVYAPVCRIEQEPAVIAPEKTVMITKKKRMAVIREL